MVFLPMGLLMLKTFLDRGKSEEYLAFPERLGISRIDQ
jgi:hypothetical protein